MNLEEVLSDVDVAIANALRGGKLSRRVLRNEIAKVLADQCCKRCGETIRETITLDNDPAVDRIEQKVGGRQLTAKQWGIFQMMWRRGHVDRAALEDGGLVRYTRRSDGDRSHTVRAAIANLRKILKGTPFAIVSRNGLPGEGAQYWLERKSGEFSA